MIKYIMENAQDKITVIEHLMRNNVQFWTTHDLTVFTKNKVPGIVEGVVIAQEIPLEEFLATQLQNLHCLTFSELQTKIIESVRKSPEFWIADLATKNFHNTTLHELAVIYQTLLNLFQKLNP